MNEPSNVRPGKGKRDPDKKRNSIIQAAKLEFCANGYKGTSMDRVALRANASKRTVYNYFPSKELLFQGLIGEYGRALYALKQINYESSRPLAAQLAKFVTAELAILRDPEWKGFTRVLVAAFVGDPELASQTAAQFGSGEDSLCAWIKAAAADRRLVVDDPVLAAQVFSAMLGGAFTWPAIYRGYLDTEGLDDLQNELIATFLSRYEP